MKSLSGLRHDEALQRYLVIVALLAVKDIPQVEPFQWGVDHTEQRGFFPLDWREIITVLFASPPARYARFNKCAL